MGTLLKAICTECNFTEKILFGGGRMNFTKVCNVPAISKKTGKFVVRSYFKDKSSPDFTFYNQPGMYSGKIEDDYHQWGEIFLKPHNNLCPLCKSFTMDFQLVGCYD